MNTQLLSTKQKLGTAFGETANLIALGPFLGVTAWLTSDVGLLIAGLIIEAVYLGWACLPLGYQKRAESRRAETQRRQARAETILLDRVLLLVTFAGFVVILFFGFGKHLLTHPYPSLSHAAGWEAGALIWTGFFLFYYLVKFRVTGKAQIDKLLSVIFAAVSGWLIYQAWNTMGNPIEHVRYVFCIGGCFALIDLLASIFHVDPTGKEQRLSKASLCWADAPMVVTFLILLGYLYFHHDTEHPDVFVSGVIACQLLMSNAIFIAMEFEFLEPSREASDQAAAQNADNSLVQPGQPAA